MSDSPQYSWQQFVIEAFLEPQPEVLQRKISIAEQAVAQRMHQGPIDLREQLALQNASVALELFKAKKVVSEHSSVKKSVA
jgi:hypothetical protein